MLCYAVPTALLNSWVRRTRDNACLVDGVQYAAWQQQSAQQERPSLKAASPHMKERRRREDECLNDSVCNSSNTRSRTAEHTEKEESKERMRAWSAVATVGVPLTRRAA